jgi:hypothetical protein
MADEKRMCAHPGCSCPADEGSKYCSAYCEGAGSTPEIDCNCGCPTCENNL